MHLGLMRDGGVARMRDSLRHVLPVPLVAVLLSACIATSGDPCADAERDVNLFTLLDNSLSGTYDACLDDLRDDLARARLRARILQGEADRLEAESETLEGERAEAVLRLAGLNARQADALNRLEEAREGQTVDQLVLDDVLEREQDLASELEVLNRNGGIDSAEAQRFEDEQSDLMERIDVLLGDG